jgi:hypothetical protein
MTKLHITHGSTFVLKISSRLESGTEVELIVPNQAAFKQKSSVGLQKRLGESFNRIAVGQNNGR